MNIRNNGLTSAILILMVAGLAVPSSAKSGPSGKGGAGGTSNGIVTGTITAVDATAGTITVTSSTGTASTIAFTTKTSIVDHTTLLASEITVGDTLSVTATLAAVDAASVVKVTTSTTTTGTGTSGGGTGTGSSGGAGCPTLVSGSVNLNGVVASLDPLTLTVGGSITVTLNTTDSTTFTQVGAGTAADLATGEAVTVLVSKSKSGALTASQITVSLAS